MNLLLQITSPFGGYTVRKVVKDIDEVQSAIESSDIKGRIRLMANVSALNLLRKMMNGEKKPCKSFMGGNDYFGKVSFKFERIDKTGPDPRPVFSINVKVFSALGSTLGEHDIRYRRNKEIKFNSIRSRIESLQ